MPGRRLWIAVVAFISLFMFATVVIALVQEDVNWGWWWVLPIAGLFVVAVLGFRVAVQRSVEAADRADREADRDA
ncbi:hypothetical protein LKO27_09500 [Tessaracoccus sp. OS52]|uniref:hypothetical protein n=1 Tax=Tessaracoccus sp. OS52 TaxID=2886691 RepID=UPI001D10F71E|nr:hypothetical protein [Tessaracoccus sp. OS52]MCC2593639.1 hypothetical protein [Tessaracoccus sp. OS52]